MAAADQSTYEEADGRDYITEIASILALGVMRLRARKSSALIAGDGDSSVDFSPAKSVHAPDHGEPA